MKNLFSLFLIYTLLSAGSASAIVPEASFTKADMWSLSQKIAKALRECKTLRRSSNIIVDVENDTTEFVDKTRFSELIHSFYERKTHAIPEVKEPDYEIRAKLEFQNSEGSPSKKPVYTLTAQAFQAEEKLCEKKVKITKNGSKRK